MEKVNQLLSLAKEAGASGAEYFPGERIVLNAQFRDICRTNACGRYGRCYMCPPDIGPVEDNMKLLRSFPNVIVYQSISPLEDSFDFEGMMEAGERHGHISGRIHLALKDLLTEPYLHLSSGCRLCARCAKMDDLPCRHPDIALGAVEGHGVDVYQTVKDSSLKYVNGENTVTYFGMLFYTE